VCDLPCPVPFKLDIICKAIVLYILIFQEVLDLNPRGVIQMLQGDYMMAFTPVESENHHVTTHIPPEIMTVVTHWLEVLTVGKEAWKIALTGRNLCSFKFHVVCNVRFVCIGTWRKNSIWLITAVPAVANFIPFVHNKIISSLLYNLKYHLSFKDELQHTSIPGTVTFNVSQYYMDCLNHFLVIMQSGTCIAYLTSVP